MSTQALAPRVIYTRRIKQETTWRSQKDEDPRIKQESNWGSQKDKEPRLVHMHQEHREHREHKETRQLDITWAVRICMGELYTEQKRLNLDDTLRKLNVILQNGRPSACIVEESKAYNQI